MTLIAALSTHAHWPLSEYLAMPISELLEWERVYSQLLKEQK